MIPISRRYAFALFVVLLAAAVPVWMNSGSERYVDDCADPTAFARMRAVPYLQGVSQNADDLNPGRIQWTQGYFVEPDESDTRFGVRVVRSFDPYDAIVKPKRILQRFFLPDREEVETIATSKGDLSVNIDLKIRGDYNEVVAYAFLYRDQAVQSVFWSLFRSGLGSFLGPTRPVTTVLLYAQPKIRSGDEVVSEVLESVRAMADHYWATCHPAG